MAKTITLEELYDKLADPSIPESELRAYFVEEPDDADAFAPQLAVNPKTVKVPKTPDGRARSAGAINMVNFTSRMRRRSAFYRKIGSGKYKGPIVVSEGDSWFQYPIMLDDVIDNLMKDFAVLSLGAAGDTMGNMVRKREYLKAIEQTNADFFIFSAGGNDLVADGNLAEHLLPYDASIPPVAHLMDTFNGLVGRVLGQYDTIFRQVTSQFPDVKILCHGYDYALPDNGKWLGKPMLKRKIKDKEAQRLITREMMDRFNTGLSQLARGFPTVTYVDNRNVVKDHRWHDELHPNDEGYAEVADGYKVIIDALHGQPKPRSSTAATASVGRKGRSLHIGLNFVDPDHYAGWDGELAACEFDAEDMAAIASDQSYTSKSLIREKATRDNVLKEIDSAARALKSGDIFFITYAGHGGQVPDFNRDETDDAKDETWCLFDGQLIDDELFARWAKFKPGVRILIISDSCHSGTVARSMEKDGLIPQDPFEREVTGSPRVMPVSVAARTFRQNRDFYEGLSRSLGPVDETLLTRELSHPVAASVRLISGCQDNQVSMDGIGNGAFTSALLATWKDGRFEGNYTAFHKAIVERMSPLQSPNHYRVGRPDPVYDGQSPFAI